MEKNEIKKLLYKKNPPAKFQYFRKGIFYYDCNFVDYLDEEDFSKFETVYLKFYIPIEDIGDADFSAYMQAKLLIRWLII